MGTALTVAKIPAARMRRVIFVREFLGFQELLIIAVSNSLGFLKTYEHLR